MFNFNSSLIIFIAGDVREREREREIHEQIKDTGHALEARHAQTLLKITKENKGRKNSQYAGERKAGVVCKGSVV